MKPELVVSIAALIVSGLSALFALVQAMKASDAVKSAKAANDIAKEANEKSDHSNQIAEEANQIAKAGRKTDLVLETKIRSLRENAYMDILDLTIRNKSDHTVTIIDAGIGYSRKGTRISLFAGRPKIAVQARNDLTVDIRADIGAPGQTKSFPITGEEVSIEDSVWVKTAEGDYFDAKSNDVREFVYSIKRAQSS